MSTFNLHTLLKGTNNGQSFLKNITISDIENKNLRSARTIIRAHLKDQFSRIGTLLEPKQIYTDSYLIENRDVRFKERIPKLEPRFYTQGSFQYQTLNDPATNPPQQIDLDDGIYVPMPFHNDEPAVSTSAYFAFVESALDDLCKKYNWNIQVKSTCIRILMPNGKSHIDLPLYAVPQEDFDEITKEFASLQSIHGQDIIFRNYAINDSLKVKSTKMRLATRPRAGSNGEWINSDPKELNDWFERAVEDHGDQIRRVCRYIKAWRDHKWGESNLSSIAIMTMVVEAYSDEFAKEGRPARNRDDIALLLTMQFIERKIGHKIENPVLPSQNLAHKLETDEISAIRTAAAKFVRTANEAINSTSKPSHAIALISDELGPRIPNEPSLIKICDDLRTTILSTAAVQQEHSEVTEIKSA